jgi:hypothetical protein
MKENSVPDEFAYFPKRPEQKICCYCGTVMNNNNRSRDHIPPHSVPLILQKSEARLTVPCCQKCNQYYSQFENEFAKILDHIITRIKDISIGQFDLRAQDEDTVNAFNIVLIKCAIGIYYNEWRERFNQEDYKFDIKYYRVDEHLSSQFLNICPSEIAPDISLESYVEILCMDERKFVLPKYQVLGEYEFAYNADKDDNIVYMLFKKSLGVIVRVIPDLIGK